VTGRRKRITKKKCKFDKDESQDSVTVPVKIGKEDKELFFFPKPFKDDLHSPPSADAPKTHDKGSSSSWTSWLHKRRLEREVCPRLYHKNSSSHRISEKEKRTED
jgi:hypothetical protein